MRSLGIYIICLLFHKGIASDAIALHQLVSVNAAGDAVIRLMGYDYDGDSLTYRILNAPTSGTLYQLSQVFSAYGYNPKQGSKINTGDTIVTGSNNRVYYKRPSPDMARNDMWDTFTFLVFDGNKKSQIATVTLVPPNGQLVGSDFLLGHEDWNIYGNKAIMPAAFEPYSRGSLLNYYVMGTDDKINVQGSGGIDTSLWFFNAPQKFLGNKGIAYGGSLQFTVSGFSGDFNDTNGDAHLVELECNTCVGPVGRGIMLVFPVSAAQGTFTGTTRSFTIPLLENKGWLKDPQNTLLSWRPPTQCDLIQVLSRLSAFRILGDWTKWYETVALDNVGFFNTQGKLPLCSMQRPDASICTC
jgi:hypothetical protein